MKIYDVTLPIREGMLVWPGDRGVFIERVETLENDGSNTSRFSFSAHTGTHIDAPNHFVKNGVGIDKVEVEKLIGECTVIDLTGIDHLEIMPKDIADVPLGKGSRLLLKTGNFRFLKRNVFPKSYVSLSMEAARYLAKKRIYLIGTDFLGIEKRKNPCHPVHKTLLQAGIVNVEGLDLEKVQAGSYDIICLPLKVVGADGSPARVMLIKR
jgi:arylformamidase